MGEKCEVGTSSAGIFDDVINCGRLASQRNLPSKNFSAIGGLERDRSSFSANFSLSSEIACLSH